MQGSQTSIGSQYVQGSQSVQACPSSQSMHGSQPTASSLQPFGTGTKKKCSNLLPKGINLPIRRSC